MSAGSRNGKPPRPGNAAIGILFAALCFLSGGESAEGTSRSRATARECPRVGTEAVSFARALDGETFSIADGREVKLAGVLAPGADGERISERQAESAREALAQALMAGPLTLAAAKAPDRYSRLLAQVFAGSASVQETLLKQGLVRAVPDRVGIACADRLMAAEASARASRAGHWGDGRFAIHSPEDLARYTGSFQIVEARVHAATVFKGRAYINFGADYRTDFTVTVAPADMRAFRLAHMDMPGLEGKRVRVRGWVDVYNGPEMTIADPKALEILD